MHNYNQIQYINKLIHMTCCLLGINVPYVYYFQNENNEFKLYDHKLNLISYEKRDMNYIVKQVKFIPKEYTIYINKNILTDEIKTYILIIMQCRAIYQLKQIIYYSRNMSIDIPEFLAKKWLYSFNVHSIYNDRTYMNDLEIDQNAFCYILIKILLNISLHFDTLEENLRSLKSRTDILYNEYNIYRVWKCAEQYGIKPKYIPKLE